MNNINSFSLDVKTVNRFHGWPFYITFSILLFSSHICSQADEISLKDGSTVHYESIFNSNESGITLDMGNGLQFIDWEKISPEEGNRLDSTNYNKAMERLRLRQEAHQKQLELDNQEQVQQNLELQQMAKHEPVSNIKDANKQVAHQIELNENSVDLVSSVSKKNIREKYWYSLGLFGISLSALALFLVRRKRIRQMVFQNQITSFNNSTVFKTRSPVTPTLIQRILRITPKENAVIEVINLIANAGSISNVFREDVIKIEERYKVNLNKKFGPTLELLYSNYLQSCLSDKHIDEEEANSLSRLKQLFSLNDKTANRLHNDIVQTIYKESVEEAIKDGRLTGEEKFFLEKLQKEVCLSDEIVKGIYAKASTEHINAYLSMIGKDERLSPQEDAELTSIAKNLSVAIDFTDKTKKLLDEYRLYWLIENGELPEIATEINLQKDEKCYAKRDINWYENRRVTKRIRYSGPSFRIKLAKGLYWRIGEVSVQPISEDVLSLIDSGEVYLTNKRIIFTGNRKNTSLRLSKILDFTVFKNGIEITKDSGKSPLLGFEESVNVFAMILGRMIKELLN